MNTKETIRARISTILDISIQKDQWSYYVDLLDREGKLTRKRMLEIIMQLCQSVEELEEALQDLKFLLNQEKYIKTPDYPHTDETS